MSNENDDPAKSPPQWKLKKLEQERLTKERLERENSERLRKIEAIKKKHNNHIMTEKQGEDHIHKLRGSANVSRLQRTTSVASGKLPRTLNNHSLPPRATDDIGVQPSSPRENVTFMESVDKGGIPIPTILDIVTIEENSSEGSPPDGVIWNFRPTVPPSKVKLKEMAEEIARMRKFKDELEKRHNNKIRDLETNIVQEKTKKEEMQEELGRIRYMKEEIEQQHLDYQKRLEKKIQEEISQRAEIEAELNRTRQRLLEELEGVKEAKDQLSLQIDTLKLEAEKKSILEEELERVKSTKEQLDEQIEHLKGEAERRQTIELELERIKCAKEELTTQIESLHEETSKKNELELELKRVHDTREKLTHEIEKLKAETTHRV